jgi:hypothetical protein
VPVSPVLHLQGLDAIVVVHTDLASAFDASRARGIPIFEIKPSIPSGDAEVGYFWASATALSHWIDQGDRDAEQQVGALLESLCVSASLQISHQAAQRAGDRLDEIG